LDNKTINHSIKSDMPPSPPAPELLRDGAWAHYGGYRLQQREFRPETASLV